MPDIPDPFNILGNEFDVPPTFEEAVREQVDQLQKVADRFAALYEEIPEDRYSDEEWRVVELAVGDIEEFVEQAQDGYVAVQYDSSAWYRIMENFEKIRARLESAIGMMERVRDRG